jgi:hypothetical protein
MNPKTGTFLDGASPRPIPPCPTHRASFRHITRIGSTLGWISGVCVAILAADAKPVTTSQPPAEPLPARSVFVDDPEGKDPFFPNSTRRSATKPEAARPALKAGPQSVRLGGIVGTEERRVALINNQGFEAGEERRVRMPGANREFFTLRCLEIRENSVVVTIDGNPERYEIQMAEFGISISPDAR